MCVASVFRTPLIGSRLRWIACTESLLPLFWHSSQHPHDPLIVFLEALGIVLGHFVDRSDDNVGRRIICRAKEFAAWEDGKGFERFAVGDWSRGGEGRGGKR